MKSFLSGKSNHSASSLAPVAPKPSISAGGSRPPHLGHSGGPQVDLVKEGGKVARIIITCTCGERVEVECLYPAGQ